MCESAINYAHPDGIEELGGYVVTLLFVRSPDPTGELGWTVLLDVGVRPSEGLGDDSRAARAALATARRVHELSADVRAPVGGGEGLMKVGVHWGAGLYLGQLVPSGRLDAVALGLEPEAMSYRLLGELASDRPKALRDAATIPVTTVG